MNSPGFALKDAVALVVAAGVLGSVAIVMAEPGGRTEKLNDSLFNLRSIGRAIGQFRHDHAGRPPVYLTYTRGTGPQYTMEGWDTWQFGGKNNDPWWSGRLFDVEAADRPLNPYLYPNTVWRAPAPPARLPANDPGRNQQAKVFRDPADIVGHEENWPMANPSRNGAPPLSCYDDVGTSYLTSMGWWTQPEIVRVGQFVPMFNEGVRRMTSDEGVIPSRFLYLVDQIGDLAPYHSSPNFRIDGNHGGQNQGVVLFADGHAGLVTFRAGNNQQAYVTPEYSMWFEP